MSDFSYKWTAGRYRRPLRGRTALPGAPFTRTWPHASAHRECFDSSGVCFMYVFVRVVSCVRTHVHKPGFCSELKATQLRDRFLPRAQAPALELALPKSTFQREGGSRCEHSLLWHALEAAIFKAPCTY